MVTRLLRNEISPIHLFVTGMLCIPGYLFQDTLWVRLVQVGLFGLLAAMNGKRIKWVYFVGMVVSIAFFNLLTPIGRVLYRLGPFVVTAGALEQGILKGMTIVGLVFISLFSIRPELRLPGRLGGLIGSVFLYYERILEGKRKLQARHLISSIDEVLEGLFTPGEVVGEGEKAAVRSTPIGHLFAVCLIGVTWASLLLL
ncbi:MAG TPA: hypothetical protein VMW87_15590 [Spirochaetia bacterium]|nr:hypothetical protein [Spirochaetia bacterium]